MKKVLTVSAAVLLAASLAGCSMSKQEKGTLGGAVVGGAIGTAIGGSGTGAVVGGATGAAVGGLVGHQITKD